MDKKEKRKQLIEREMRKRGILMETLSAENYARDFEAGVFKLKANLKQTLASLKTPAWDSNVYKPSFDDENPEIYPCQVRTKNQFYETAVISLVKKTEPISNWGREGLYAGQEIEDMALNPPLMPLMTRTLLRMLPEPDRGPGHSLLAHLEKENKLFLLQTESHSLSRCFFKAADFHGEDFEKFQIRHIEIDPYAEPSHKSLSPTEQAKDYISQRLRNRFSACGLQLNLNLFSSKSVPEELLSNEIQEQDTAIFLVERDE